jgi:signal transduction histidine kinase
MLVFLQNHSLKLVMLGLLLAALAILGVAAAAWSAAAAQGFVLLILICTAGFAIWQRRENHNLGKRIIDLTRHYQQQAALLEICATAWSMFNREGVMLRNNLQRLFSEERTLRHLDDLVALFEDGASLVENFRALQKHGQEFTLQLSLIDRNETLRVKGQMTPLNTSDYVYVMEFHPLRTHHRLEIVPAPAPSLPEAELLDALPFPVWTRNDALKLLWVNHCYARWCGRDRATIIAEQIELLQPLPSNRNLSAQKILSAQELAASAKQKNSSQEERASRVIGEQRRLIVFNETPLPVLPATNPDQPVLLGLAQDVTETAEITEDLRRHIAAHREVLESLGTPITIYGADQKLEFYNRAYLRLWDHDEEFLNTKPSFGDILEDLRRRRRAPEQVDFGRYKRERTALFTSLIEPSEDMMHLPDGTALRIVSVPHPFGGVMFLHEDVTDKLALESSYNTLIAVQRETLDNLSEGIAVLGADGRLKLYNPVYASIWKLTKQQLEHDPHINDLTEAMRPLIPAETWENFRETMINAALQREEQEIRLVRADGRILNFKTALLPDGAVLTTCVDVTDTMQVEQALRESNAALATADRLKSEFVANVSYQLRNPLSTVIGFAEILANQYFGTLNERQLDYAQTIMESSKRLKLLIDDVIDLAMVDAGRMLLNRYRTDVLLLLQSVATMMGEWVKQQSLELVVDAENNLGSFVVDEKRIKQALFNLISNAIQYTPPGGKITLEARRHGQMIHLTVADTGVGIPPSNLDRVWDKFTRTAASSRNGGVGLGLSLVKSFINLHGGKIEIQSAVNQGTRITCIIPIVETAINGNKLNEAS